MSESDESEALSLVAPDLGPSYWVLKFSRRMVLFFGGLGLLTALYREVK